MTKGTAQFKDKQGFFRWYQGLTLDESAALYKKLMSASGKRYPEGRVNPISDAVSAMFQKDDSWFEKTKLEAMLADKKAETVRRYEKFLRYAEEYQQPLRVKLWDDGLFAFLYMGNPDIGVLIPEPERFLDFIPDKDYSDMTAAQVRASLGAPRDSCMNTVPATAEDSLTQKSMEAGLESQNEMLANLEQQIEDTEKAKTGELAELQAKINAMMAELDQKKQKMLAELNAKKQEMEAVKEQMENQIYLLDAQIYAIRCFAGEVVNFTRIRTGSNAPDTEPIVVHQKLRFLDEDLGRLASLYEIQWDDIGLFEDFLRYSPIGLETFAPDKRCIQLVRLSRTGVQQGRDERYPYANIMRDFHYFHGKTVGIIIRNGDNLYLGWTDEDRVHIQDDLLISNQVIDIQPGKPISSHETPWEKESREKREKAERKELLDGLISRAFVYNILQGVVEHSDILPLPAGYNLGSRSKYVIYAVADKWLADTRFGSFTEIIATGNRRVTAGDMILTVQAITPERDGRGWSSAWHNSRGRGDMNRTHDCKAQDCTIYPVNLVERDEPVPMVRYRWKHRQTPLDGETWMESVIEKSRYAELSCEKEVLEEYDRVDQHVYISLKKTGYYRDYKGDARANVELYDEEYISLTYLNSVWLEWVINTKTLGDWEVHGHPVDYAYAIAYIKTALDFVKGREADEKAFIDAVDPSVCEDADWPLKLSQWKLDAGVRAINAYQAKRFVRWLKEREKHV